jgi:CheY-like chemotaxis protein
MSKKILLADDSITIQKVVELTFSDGDYEVIAVNNGAKAIAKLGEVRPDIILSDIIMPEKNGYEVCEFVKSHPEYRNIPVILLTGTFEPFDPDRADKAGCDAVVTKPFESQSLIHKVEELIEQSRTSTAPTVPSPAMSEKPATPPPAPAASPSPWAEKPSEPSSFTSSPGFAPVPSSSNSPFSRDNDNMFGSQSSPSASEPFGAPPPAESFSGETRAIPKMSFDDAGNIASTQQVPAQPAPPAWDDQPPAFSGETRAFPRMNFDEMQRPSQPGATSSSSPSSPSSSSQNDNDSPFGASPSAESFSGETRAFPKMSMDDMKQMVSTPEPSKKSSSQESAPSPWDDKPAYSGETKAFPKMNFDELQSASPAAPSSPSPWDEAPAAPAPGWPAATSSDMSASRSSGAAEKPFGGGSRQESSMPDESASASSSPASGSGSDLTEAQVDRIARRVVQLISDQVVRNIAWEVIPDLAEMVVKERIRQLESEA